MPEAPGATVPDATLVPWPHWAPWVAHALAPLTPRERVLAREILRFLHDRHVGVPPALAADLARRLVAPLRAPGPFEPVVRRLGREVARDGPLPTVSHGAVLLSHAPAAHVLQRIALPLLARAAVELGERFLFSHSRDGDTPAAAAYSAHEQRVGSWLQAHARASGAHDEEWTERATALRELCGGRARSAAPDVGPLATALLHRTGGDVRPPRPRGRAAPAPGSASTRRSRLRVPDGGVEDVALSRSPEDLPRMLMSAWLEPELMRTLRLALGTGVPVLDRPPLREQPRDVLLVGLLPELEAGEPSRTLWKAAWLDTMMLALALLAERGLEQSEVRLIEDDGLGGARVLVARLDELDEPLPPTDTLLASPRHRDRCREALGWVPALFDRHAAPVGDALELDAPYEPWEWARAACRARADALDTGAADDFRAVHLIAALPGDHPAGDAAAAAGYRRALELSRLPHARCTIARVPRDVADLDGWGRAVAGLEPPADAELERWLVQRLQASWLEELAEVLS